ncbi:MAG: hypothetical protein CR982_07860 [Candidatus Cloacimonadota bacterium]|nr:MAG: hypothetical protein CR982_07860 [Candidatus Cloacimonadota bacterium]PIE78229.1 MAG: hypothetical protein CSA15_08680 [Candidatus Delongbacteria bacterium]
MKRLAGRKLEAFIFLAVFLGFFGYLASIMGLANMLNTLMKTAHDLLMNTVFYIMGITVLAGALGKLMIEFGVVRLLEAMLAPFMRPIFNLPGVASLGALMTFFSDNPAIISLAHDRNFKNYFKKYELISLTNFGTAFGMGLIVLTFMFGKGYFAEAFLGFAGAIIGAGVSTRLMQALIRKDLADSEKCNNSCEGDNENISFKSEGNLFLRFLNSILDGGKQGVDLGLAIIPGVIIISSMIMIVTFGVHDPSGYTGGAYEGVPLLPQLAGYFDWFFSALFGFEYPELIAFPITSLGAVGAALSIAKEFFTRGIAGGNEVAVFTAMGMCWSGYLSTHTAMLDALKSRELTSRALISHTIGGIVAGTSAHYLYLLFVSFG